MGCAGVFTQPRPIAVAGTQRISSLPDVPAISETLKGVDLQGWFMVIAPAGTPAEIVNTMSKAIAKALAEPDVVERAPTLGFEVEQGANIPPDGAKDFLDVGLRR
ncbi:tripartite tricarboxylate transporter substrate-binding protein [Agrobacterium vaccinii]|uniref:tripartite tricarboxylate transporter substrate-binding protein n=1 Tax=Agrobacterium vaccinii TaxID=2735528 RepID=UPI001E28D227|nr:tripartite tricarboxylate transporter substrate-binding protein [Agrobacterium vaccinii]